MPEFEITSTTKMIAVALAIITAYFSSSDWVKTLLSHLNPIGPIKQPDNTPEVDSATRVLLTDSKDRKCLKSIRLLNEWTALRNVADLLSPTTIPTAVTTASIDTYPAANFNIRPATKPTVSSTQEQT